MEELFVDCKLNSYLAGMALAEKAGDKERQRKAVQKMMMFTRMRDRCMVNGLVDALNKVRAAERVIQKSKEQGVTVPFLEKRLEAMKANVRQRRKDLIQAGEITCAVLDMWQELGATLKDLCSLCNRDYDQVVAEIGPEHLDLQFSEFIFIYNLDYKDPRNRGWINFDIDAPLTHAAKEYMMDIMLNTKTGQEASHEAFVKCFPELWDKRMYAVADDDGVQHMVDKDGIEMGTIGEEET
ncbi:MAG: hypothetical protein LKK00_09395 [Intestinimonas sp.]|jgi:hypothetical protein|nr:hypothetical protein [Intestinimonas sp.]